MKKLRFQYFLLFLILFLIELGIALFLKDPWIRPYVGDLLITVLLCSFVRIWIPTACPSLPFFVFLFSAFVEFCQYFDVVKLLHWEDCAVLSVLIGRTFSFADLICYGIGCLSFWQLEQILRKKRER